MTTTINGTTEGSRMTSPEPFGYWRAEVETDHGRFIVNDYIPAGDVTIQLIPTTGSIFPWHYVATLPSPPEGTAATVVDTYTEVASKPHKNDRHYHLPPITVTVTGGRWVDEYGVDRGQGPRPTPRHTNYT